MFGKHSNAVVYLLRQKMKCGYCGANMSYEEALMKEPQMLINFLIREIIVFDDEITSTSIAPYRRVLTQVRAFLFVTGKRPYRRISRTRMN